VDEDGESKAELVAMEGSLRFADYDGVESSLGVTERVEKPGGFWLAAASKAGNGIDRLTSETGIGAQ